MRSMISALRYKVSDIVRDIRPATDYAKDNPAGDLAQHRANILKTRFDKPLTGIQGWLTPNERKTLYALGRHLDGPFLEIGPWAGLSTSCIAYGIRDSQKKKFFLTVELNPSMEHFRPLGDEIGFFFPKDSAKPRAVADKATFERDVVPVLARKGRVLSLLHENLKRLQLRDFVEILAGDFTQAPNLGYKFIFCDATHGYDEIAINAPALRPYLSPGTVLACHDITASDEKHLRSFLPLGYSFTVDSLFVGEVIGEA